MSYRKIEPKLIDLDELVGVCGLFTSDTGLNNGYGCKSKSKEKSEVGMCYGFDCPLAYEADLTEIKKHSIEIYNSEKQNFTEEQLRHEDDCCPSFNHGNNWMIQVRELKKKGE